jgi:hypothetical protein
MAECEGKYLLCTIGWNSCVHIGNHTPRTRKLELTCDTRVVVRMVVLCDQYASACNCLSYFHYIKLCQKE